MPERYPNSSAARQPGEMRTSAVERYGVIGLTLACGLWMVLLSPKTISGLPAGSTAKQQAPAKASLETIAGAVAAATSVSFPASMVVSDKDIPVGLRISPSQAEMAVGNTEQFKLVDRNGHGVPGATWMVSDFTVAELDSVEPARIAGVSPGQVTITAMLGDQSVQAKVTVVRPTADMASSERSSSARFPKGR